MFVDSIKFEYFFDRPEMLRRMSRKEARDLSRIGAYARNAIRKSMRPGKGKKTSAPGKPPLYHTGALRNGILFAYEPSKHVVVVGARKLNGRIAQGIPRVLNEGGTITQLPNKRRLRGPDASGRPVLSPTQTGARRVNIAARPFASDKAVTWPNILDKWREITERNRF